ncbi:hypothetical protein HNQ94_000113 [Salirhabdus euzebyi]|uniref:Uncharacterized protein n=1 Tax=Salirhabdus euzebyi TaxID=394506 RepID=A0A841Q189_9BACI|nr:hypothetical protein [Salirhabdus euzebyi]MBB6451692.1 hypothetical protein [Salirhabdus euzebyi]
MKQYDERTEFDQTFQSFESIQFDERDKKEVYTNIMNKIENKPSKNRFSKWSKHILTTAVVAIFFIVGGYLLTDKFIMDQANPTPLDENKKTIQTYLEKEFTGPNEELSNILDNGIISPEFNAYREETYGDLVANFKNMVNLNHILVFLIDAHMNGYQLNPKTIDIQEIEDTQNNVYNYKVEVEYSKGNQVNTATVTGIINLDENGKISMIRKMDGRELLEKINQSIHTTLKEVETAITEQGLELEEPDLPSGNAFIQELNDVSPKAYFIDERTLSIYEFPTVQAREKGMEDFEEKTATMRLVPHETYTNKNILVFYVEGNEETNNKIKTAITELE